MRQDGILKIATGSSRFEKNWKTKTITWAALVEGLSKTSRTRETVAEYFALPKPQQDAIKDVGGFVGGAIKKGRRNIENVTSRSVLTLDADHAPRDFDARTELDLNLGCAAMWYSTHKHTTDHPRLRIVLPLSREVNAEEYQAISRKVAEIIGIDHFDDTTYQPHRLMYWPSTSKDGIFDTGEVLGRWLDPDEILRSYSDWTDASQWPVSSRQAHAIKKMADVQGDPTLKNGMVGAFCRTYSIDEAILEFLPDVYEQATDDRYTFLGGSTSAGCIVYQDGAFLYSHHATDPVGGTLVNAFDLVRIHRFSSLDENAATDTPITKKPSYVAMCEMAATLPAVKQMIAHEKIEAVNEDFEDTEEGTEAKPKKEVDWTTKLQISAQGVLLSSAKNVLLILANDTRLQGAYKLDEFCRRVSVVKDLPWRAAEKSLGWTDTDDAGLRNYLSVNYGIKGAGVIMDAWREDVSKNAFHPVKDYLGALVWDGVKRVDRLFIDFLGAADSRYTKEVTRKALVAGVARVYQAGIKFDNVLVTVGKQGMGKSYILKALGGKWFSDSLTTVAGKDAYEQLQGIWIVEMAELSATRKAEAEAIKHFLSKQEDIYRVAYDKHTSSFPRQCIIFGTTNDESFLKDKTGNRRFWPVKIGLNPSKKSVFKDLKEDIVDQVWAEAVHLYKAGEKLYLEADVEAEADQARAGHEEEDHYGGIIARFLDRKLPANWDSLEAYERNNFINGDLEGTIQRTKTCIIEIWVECFRGRTDNCTPAIRRDIGSALNRLEGWDGPHKVSRFKDYGPQKTYYKEIEL